LQPGGKSPNDWRIGDRENPWARIHDFEICEGTEIEIGDRGEPYSKVWRLDKVALFLRQLLDEMDQGLHTLTDAERKGGYYLCEAMKEGVFTHSSDYLPLRAEIDVLKGRNDYGRMFRFAADWLSSSYGSGLYEHPGIYFGGEQELSAFHAGRDPASLKFLLRAYTLYAYICSEAVDVANRHLALPGIGAKGEDPGDPQKSGASLPRPRSRRRRVAYR